MYSETNPNGSLNCGLYIHVHVQVKNIVSGHVQLAGGFNKEWSY